MIFLWQKHAALRLFLFFLPFVFFLLPQQHPALCCVGPVSRLPTAIGALQPCCGDLVKLRHIFVSIALFWEKGIGQDRVIEGARGRSALFVAPVADSLSPVSCCAGSARRWRFVPHHIHLSGALGCSLSAAGRWIHWQSTWLGADVGCCVGRCVVHNNTGHIASCILPALRPTGTRPMRIA